MKGTVTCMTTSYVRVMLESPDTAWEGIPPEEDPMDPKSRQRTVACAGLKSSVNSRPGWIPTGLPIPRTTRARAARVYWERR